MMKMKEKKYYIIFWILCIMSLLPIFFGFLQNLQYTKGEITHSDNDFSFLPDESLEEILFPEGVLCSNSMKYSPKTKITPSFRYENTMESVVSGVFSEEIEIIRPISNLLENSIGKITKIEIYSSLTFESLLGQPVSLQLYYQDNDLIDNWIEFYSIDLDKDLTRYNLSMDILSCDDSPADGVGEDYFKIKVLYPTDIKSVFFLQISLRSVIHWEVLSEIESEFNWFAPKDDRHITPLAIGRIRMPYIEEEYSDLGLANLKIIGIDTLSWQNKTFLFRPNGALIWEEGDEILLGWRNYNPNEFLVVISSSNRLDTRIGLMVDSRDFNINGDYYELENGFIGKFGNNLYENQIEGYMDTEFIQPNEDFVAIATSSLMDNSKLDLQQKDIKIDLLEGTESDYYWNKDESYNEFPIEVVSACGATKSDSLLRRFKVDTSSPYEILYPFFAYETEPYNKDFLGTIGVNVHKTPLKIYEYSLKREIEYDFEKREFEVNIEAPPIPQLNNPELGSEYVDRLLSTALLREVKDTDNDQNYYEETSYEIPLDIELLNGVSLTSMTLPERVYTYNSLTDDSISPKDNQIKLKFSEGHDAPLHISLEIRPSLMKKAKNNFEVYNITCQKSINEENGEFVISGIPFNSRTEDPKSMLKLPPRNLFLDINLVIRKVDQNGQLLLDATLPNRMIYLGDIKSDSLKDKLFEIKEIQFRGFKEALKEDFQFSFSYNLPYQKNENNYYLATILQDENLITYGKGDSEQSCLIPISTSEDIKLEFLKDTPSLISSTDIQKFSFNITEGYNLIDNGIEFSIYKFFDEPIIKDHAIERQNEKEIYDISIDPKDLPNGELILDVKTEINGKKEHFYHIFNVNYYLKGSKYYQMDYSYLMENYQEKNVQTNQFVDGKLRVNYTEKKGYNYDYMFDKSFETIISRSSSLEIWRKTNKSQKRYQKISDIGYKFEFQEKPTNEFDIIRLKVKTPSLKISDTNGIEKIEKGRLPNGKQYIKFYLQLSSRLSFKNIECIYHPALLSISNPKDYNYTLLKMSENEWIESGIDVVFQGSDFNGQWRFNISKVEKEETQYFIIYGIHKDTTPINLQHVILGILTSAIFFLVFWIMIGSNTFKTRWVFKSMTKKYYNIIGLLFTVGIFLITFSISQYLLGSFILPYKYFF